MATFAQNFRNMQSSKEKIMEMVIKSVQKVVSETRITEPSAIIFNTPLYGKNGILDSLGLVQLIADIEEDIYNITGKQITIADEKAMSLKISPFRSVASLTDYICNLL
jgi:acyl carrier protein